MLPHVRYGTRGPFFFLLHWLSGSGQSWHDVAVVLAERGTRCVAIDLPGFGNASNASGFDVRAVSDAVTEVIQAVRKDALDEPWLLGGHSMGGKIAAVVARDAINGKHGMAYLRGAFLVSPSPPSPEPMEEKMRQKMLEQLGESTGNADEERKRAEQYVDDNTGKLPLRKAVRERAVNSLLKMNRTAFRAWLTGGSKGDWSLSVGQMPLRALILAGSEEPALGPDVQRKKTLPHYTNAQVISLEGCGHIAPLERPFEVAEYATSFVTSLKLPLHAESNTLGTGFAALLESNRVSPQTRAVLETRLAGAATWNYVPAAPSHNAFRTMRALAECVVPHAGFDIAASVDERLVSGTGDGWRFATLPPDAEAWRKGLASLDAAAERQFSVPFIALHPEQQDDLLRKAGAGELGKGLLGSVHIGDGTGAYAASEMKQWFEQARGEFAKCYMAHPSTMERVGFTGFADEGGFSRIQIGQREEFEG